MLTQSCIDHIAIVTGVYEVFLHHVDLSWLERDSKSSFSWLWWQYAILFNVLLLCLE